LRGSGEPRTTATAEPGIRCVLGAAARATHPVRIVTYLAGLRLITSRDPVEACDILTRYGMTQLLDRAPTARQRGASGVHRKAGLPPIFRRRGDLRAVRDVPPWARESIPQLAAPDGSVGGVRRVTPKMPPSHPMTLSQAVRDLTNRANPVVGWLQAHHIHTIEGLIEQNRMTPAGERLVNAGRSPRECAEYTRIFLKFQRVSRSAPRLGPPAKRNPIWSTWP
jgi:hypothetical protein